MNEFYLRSFCREFDYPEEAVETLAAGLKAMEATPAMAKVLAEQLEKYVESGTDFEPNEGLKEIREHTAEVAAHPYTQELVYYILLSRHLRELYQDAGLPYEIYYRSMCDLRYKLMECHNVYKVWGSFVADWFCRFFNLRRFALGRLQYEPYQLSEDCHAYGKFFQKGTFCINVHIPSAGPLIPEEVEESFRLATAFFADKFEGDEVMFMCHSWLLFPENDKILPDTSRIRAFMRCFEICKEGVVRWDGDLWRIFGIEEKADWRALMAEGKLPAETGVQKCYLKYLQSGEIPGGGLGIRFQKKDK